GPDIARDLRWYSLGKFTLAHSSLASEEMFLKELADEVSDGLNVQIQRALNPGTHIFGTFPQTFTDANVDQLRAGTLLLYIMTVATWKDAGGSHMIEECVYLRPPATDPVWRTCETR